MTLTRGVFADTLARFFEPIGGLLSDRSVREVLINRYDRIFVERDGVLERTEARFRSEAHLMSALTNLAQSVGRTLDRREPRIEATLPDGSRVVALLPPVALDGPCVTIRCTRDGGYPLDSFFDCVLDPSSLRASLVDSVSKRRNLLICGKSGSGKTTLLLALSSIISPDERVVAIGGDAELRVDHDHAVRLVAAPSFRGGVGSPTTSELLRMSLRLRADRIVLGDIGAGDAAELLRVLSCSQASMLTTVEASGPREALASIEEMAHRSEPMASRAALAKRVAGAVDVVIHTEKRSDGRRSIASVSEVLGWRDDSGFTMQNIYEAE